MFMKTNLKNRKHCQKIGVHLSELFSAFGDGVCFFKVLEFHSKSRPTSRIVQPRSANNFSMMPISGQANKQTALLEQGKLLWPLQRPSKGGSLVALSHPFVYLCRLTSRENCRCRFSVQIHMSLSLQEFVCDVSLQ